MCSRFVRCGRSASVAFYRIGQREILEDAVEAVLDAGYRTRDIVNEGNADETLVGCKEMGDLVAAKVAELAA